MVAKRYKPEEVISKLREAEVLLAEGVSVGGALDVLSGFNDGKLQEQLAQLDAPIVPMPVDDPQSFLPAWVDRPSS